MKTHSLKIWPRWFNGVINGTKTFEVRKMDRDYLIGDYLLLKEFNQTNNEFTGRSCTVMITTILMDSNFLNNGYGILGIKLVKDVEFNTRLEILKSDLWLANEDWQIKDHMMDMIQTCQNMAHQIETDKFFRKHLTECLEQMMPFFNTEERKKMDRIMQKFSAKESSDVQY